MNFSGLSEGGNGACELDPILFLFIGTTFLGAIEGEGRWFRSTGFMDGREKVQVVCEMKKRTIEVIYSALGLGV